MTTRPDSTAGEDPDSPFDYDVVVVGGGAAGLSASLFTARAGLGTLVLAQGKSAIRQCAHLENYLGFPGGLSPDRFLALGRAQAELEGATVESERVEALNSTDPGFRVETAAGTTVRARRVIVATAYDGESLETVDGDAIHETDEGFLRTEKGRTGVDGLYAAGWMTADTVHQAVVNAGDGARTALTLVRDEMSERYWPALGERYVDWVVDEGRYGGDGWDQHIDEWMQRELLPADVDDALIEQAREDVAAEFLDRQISDAEKERRQREGQRRLLAHLDDDVIADYHAEHLADDRSGGNN
jgi:hypothetical protein